MCGITGAVPGISGEQLRAMTGRLAHRGPDGEDYFSTPDASLGHRRLAIIDLPGGRQPMTTADGRFTIVFNGEIYNFTSLRSELESVGRRFRTRSDTEVLLEAFAEWGRASLDRLRGMFAFAVWDSRARSLFLARDRLGVKPLYYTLLHGRQLLFASEIKALLAHPEIPRRLNPCAVDDYLTFLYVPAPQTILKGIVELPPAHWLEWRDGATAVQRYWDALPLPAGEGRNGSAAAASDELLTILAEAVRLRLISDVPLGAFLSGGLDSSSIVALMAQASREPVRSFSLGFRAGEERYTELEFARQVSQHCRTDHRELEIQPQCANLLPRIVAQFDEPFGNPTALLLYQLSELTRRYVTVALAGDAGDEVFLGYPRYQGLRLRALFDFIPRALRSAVAGAAASIPDDLNGRHTWRRMREFLSTGAEDWRAAYSSWVCYFLPEMRGALYTEDLRASLAGYNSRALLDDCFARVEHCHPLNQASYVDLHTFLPYNLLEYGDRMSMAHALEVRLPFTDHKLVEFALRLSPESKLRGRETKALLRRAVGPLLPPEILSRTKLGLNPPLGIWLQRDLAPLVNRYLSPESVRRRGWFQPEYVTRLLEGFRSGRRDYSLHIWSLLVLEEWCRQYLDGERPLAGIHEPVAAGERTIS